MPVVGTISSGLYLVDFDSTFNAGDAFSGIAPLQRLKVCVRYNKASYNAEVFTQNAVGDFDTNLARAKVFITDFPPVNGQLLNSTLATQLSLEINDSTDTYETCTTIRGEEEWANLGQSKFLVFSFLFSYNINGDTFIDTVYKVVRLSFRKYDLGTGIQLVNITDRDDNVLTDNFCSTYEGFVYLNFRSLLPNTYTHLGFYKSTNGNVNEKNEHTNNNLPQIVTPLIGDLDPVNPINSNDTFRMCVESRLLARNFEYCFVSLLIQESPAPVFSSCPFLNITFAQVVTTSSANQNLLTTTFTLSGGITAADVQSVTITGNGSIIGNSTFSNTLTGTINMNINPIINNSAIYILMLTLVNGCTYEKQISMPSDQDTTITETLGINVTVCDIVIPAPFHGTVGFPQVTILGDTSCQALSGTAPTQDLITCIENVLNANGVIFGEVKVYWSGTDNLDNVYLVEILGTTLGIADITIFYTGMGQAINTIDCSNGNPTTWELETSFSGTPLVQTFELKDGIQPLAASQPWLIAFDNGAQLQADLQGWVDANGHGGTVTVSPNPASPLFKMTFANTTAPLAGAKLEGGSSKYFVEQ